MSSAFCWQEGSVSPDLYSDMEESESEEATDDDGSYEDDEDYDDDECDDATQGSDAYSDDDYVASGTGSESGHSVNNDLDDDKACSSTFLQWHLHFYFLFINFKNDGSNKLNTNFGTVKSFLLQISFKIGRASCRERV